MVKRKKTRVAGCAGRDRRVVAICVRECVGKLGFSGRGAQDDDSWRVALGGFTKRVFDVTIAGIALLVLMPIMLVTAVLIRFLMGERIILAEDLIGFGGKVFAGYKFRTKVGNAKGIAQERKADVWAELLGEAFRRSSLDKLLQFFNVIRGDMSLVGPRPIAPDELLHYRAQAPECLMARPGLTGMWRAYSNLCNHRSLIALDRYYVRHWSMRIDFALLINAIFALHHSNESA